MAFVALYDLRTMRCLQSEQSSGLLDVKLCSNDSCIFLHKWNPPRPSPEMELFSDDALPGVLQSPVVKAGCSNSASELCNRSNIRCSSAMKHGSQVPLNESVAANRLSTGSTLLRKTQAEGPWSGSCSLPASVTVPRSARSLNEERSRSGPVLAIPRQALSGINRAFKALLLSRLRELLLCMPDLFIVSE